MFVHTKPELHITHGTEAGRTVKEISISSIDRLSRQKKKSVRILKTLTAQQTNCLVDSYKTFHLTTGECTFFSSSHRTFSIIDHMWAMKEVSINLKGFKSYIVCCLITMKLNLKPITERYRKYPRIFENWIIYFQIIHRTKNKLKVIKNNLN